MTAAADIVARVHISDIAEAVGVKLDRTRRRGVAVWREGKNLSVSFNDPKNVWHDFVTGEGGGVLDFIQRVRGCDRKAALEWLSAFTGVRMDHQTEAERRAWARRMQAARPEAEALVHWKAETLEGLRYQRDRLQRIYHRAVRFVLSHDYDACEARGDLRYEIALGIGETYWPRVEELDVTIDRLVASSYTDLLRRLGGAA